jgi:hypothetical protein
MNAQAAPRHVEKASIRFPVNWTLIKLVHSAVLEVTKGRFKEATDEARRRSLGHFNTVHTPRVAETLTLMKIFFPTV